MADDTDKKITIDIESAYTAARALEGTANRICAQLRTLQSPSPKRHARKAWRLRVSRLQLQPPQSSEPQKKPGDTTPKEGSRHASGKCAENDKNDKPIAGIRWAGILLFILLLLPAFFRFDSAGAVCMNNPFDESTDVDIKNKTANSLITVDWSAGKKITVDAKAGWPKYSSGSAYKYVNMCVCISAYILLICFVASILRRLLKNSHRREILGQYRRDFRDLLVTSPDFPQYQKQIVGEMMRVYFDKEAD